MRVVGRKRERERGGVSRKREREVGWVESERERERKGGRVSSGLSSEQRGLAVIMEAQR